MLGHATTAVKARMMRRPGHTPDCPETLTPCGEHPAEGLTGDVKHQRQ